MLLLSATLIFGETLEVSLNYDVLLFLQKIYKFVGLYKLVLLCGYFRRNNFVIILRKATLCFIKLLLLLSCYFDGDNFVLYLNTIFI